MPFLTELQQILNNPHYQPLFMFVATLIALMLLRSLLRSPHQPANKKKADTIPSSTILTNKDIEMVAGDDIITTQLDLARAYAEMGKKQLAKSILQSVVKQGKPEQQQEARQLIDSM